MEQALQLVIDLLHLPLFLIVLGTGYYFLEMAVDMAAQVLYVHAHIPCIQARSNKCYIYTQIENIHAYTHIP